MKIRVNTVDNSTNVEKYRRKSRWKINAGRCRQSCCKFGKVNDRTRTEQVHEALSKSIAANRLPLSFCSNIGFQDLVSVVQLNLTSRKEEAIKRKLAVLKASTEQETRKIKYKL